MIIKIDNISKQNQLIYLDMFNDLSCVVNANHIKVCPCQKEIVSEAFEKDKKEPDEVSYRKSLDKNQLIYRDEIVLNNTIKNIGKIAERSNIHCPVEQVLILNTIHRFDINGLGKYDLSDPDVYIILKAMINHMLSSHRMQLYSNKHGVITYRSDEQGNSYIVLNPVEKAKMDFDNAQVTAVEKLNKIVYGNKNVNLNIDFKSEMVDLYKNLKKL